MYYLFMWVFIKNLKKIRTHGNLKCKQVLYYTTHVLSVILHFNPNNE